MPNWDEAVLECRNCGTVTQGKYCHVCGQKSVVHRLTLGHLLHEIPHAVFHVDRGFFATIWQLLRQPGVAINNYLDGKRARYFNPLTLLIICVGIGVFLYSQYSFNYASTIDARLSAEVAAKYTQFRIAYNRYQSILIVLYLPILMLLTKRFFLRSGRAFGEHLVINAYTLAMIYVVYIVMFPVCVAAQMVGIFNQVSLVTVVLMTVVQVRIWYQVFRPTCGKWRTAFFVAITLIIYMALAQFLPGLFFKHVYMRL